MVISKKKIKNIRESKNLSQEYVAELLGISQTAYSKTESGRTKLSVKRLEQLADVLEVNVSVFFVTELSETVEDNSKNIKESLLRNVLDKQKEAYEKSIKTLENQIEILNNENKVLREINSDKGK